MFDKDYLEKREALKRRIRTLVVNTVKLCNKITQTTANQIIIKQLIRATSSIGANYSESCEPESASDFAHKMGITKKEARETLYWLEIFADVNPTRQVEISKLYSETKEIFLIVTKAVATTRNNKIITKLHNYKITK